MFTDREGILGQGGDLPPQAHESQVVMPLSFAAFIDAHTDEIDTLSESYLTLRNLRQAVLDSEEVEALIDEGIEHARGTQTGGRIQANKHKINREELGYFREKILTTILNKQGKRPEELPAPKNAQEAQRLDWMNRVNALAFDYQEQVEPIEEALEVASGTVNDSLTTYLLDNYQHVISFADFLEAHESRDDRVYAKVFLGLFERQERSAQRSAKTGEGGLLNRVREHWGQRLVEFPDSVHIAEFIAGKLPYVGGDEATNGVSKGERHTGFDLVEHIEFARQRERKRFPGSMQSPLSEMSVTEIIDQEMPDYQDWPEKLRREYEHWLRNAIASTISRIRSGLLSYRFDEKASHLGDGPASVIFHSKREEAGEESTSTEQVQPFPSENVVTVRNEVEPSGRYRLGKLYSKDDIQQSWDVAPLGDEDQEALIDEYAKEFSPVPHVRENFKTAIEYLLKDPHPRHNRRGIKKLVNAHQRIGGMQGEFVELNSFDPAGASGLSVSRQFPRATRIVYFIDERDKEHPRIALKVFKDHNSYERFVRSKTRKR